MRPPAPRWFKLAAALVIVLIVLLVVTRVAGVEHGPARHGGGSDGDAPAAGGERHSPPAGVPEHRVPRP